MSEQYLEKLKARADAQPKPICAALTPFVIIDTNAAMDWVKFEFSPQEAFRNHFGNVQGGFAVAMLDAVVSVTAFAKTGLWLPTVEMKASFLEPLPIGTCIAEGRVLRNGKKLAFLEGSLFSPNGRPAVVATATAIVPES